MVDKRIPTITLLTDYGTRDGYVPSIKGVILNINPNVQIVDITHEIPAQDILDASFVLRSCYSYFPPRTIHIVVVDPTVGSSRKLLLVATENYYFIAPDNGVLSLIYEAETVSTVIELTTAHYFLNEISNTFHGRDIMAPTAAWLAKGNPVENFGEPTQNYLKLSFPKPKMVGEGMLKGTILHVDRFGNLITNIKRSDYDEIRSKIPGETFKSIIGKQEINGLKQYYAQGQKGELLALFGSSDFLEIAQTQGSAAKTLGAARGAEVGILLK
ncbi:MAG TPA: SAM-dependent chlorinase/fluorinase [Acidobacteriota bacterium]|jgi:S-adenosylmethionine hydrolase|nr:SAM-dependent chlorinase/fluorinase [Acidobacteriota bacterium]